MKENLYWFLACGPVSGRGRARLRRRVFTLASQKREEGCELATDFPVYDLRALWPDAAPAGQWAFRQEFPGQFLRPGDGACVFCYIKSKHNRDNLEVLKDLARARNVALQVCLI